MYIKGFLTNPRFILCLIVSLEVLRKQIPDFIQTNDFLEIGVIFGLLLIFGIIISWISTFFSLLEDI